MYYIYIIQEWPTGPNQKNGMTPTSHGVCRLQKCEIEEANEANTLVWTRQTLVHGYTYDNIYIYVYIYHIVDTTDRCLLHTSFFGAVIFLRWWLNINHRTRPTCSHSNDFERVVSKSQVLYVWMDHQYLIASHNSEEPSRKDVHPITNSGLKIRGIS